MADTNEKKAVPQEDVDIQDINTLEAQTLTKPMGKWEAFYRGTLFQMLVTGAVAFAGPAMSDALSGLGGGGLATPYTANAGSAASYSMMAVTCLFGGPLINRLGVKWSLALGAMAFPLNGSSLYVNSKYGIQWYLIFGHAVSGLGTGLWYVAEAAIILSYPEPGRRGRYLALWILSRNLGQLVGGAINLSVNVNTDTTGGISPSTYLIFVGIECIGFPAALFLSPPEKVRRADGTGVHVAAGKSTWKNEFIELGKVITLKRTLLLVGFFFYSFFYISVYGTYLSTYFTVRARALSSLVSPAFCIVGCFALGWILDLENFTQRKRAQMGFALVVISAITIYIYTCVVQAGFNAHDPGTFDWTSPGWARAFMPYFLIQTFGPIGQSYMYWLISCYAKDVQTNSRNAGVFRSLEAVGQAVSYGINSHAENLFVGFGINFGLLVVVAPLMYLVVRTVPERMPMEIEEQKDLERAKAQVQHAQEQEELEEK
ncbi:MFS general substrate transporter [Stereum hirsutum FP-91666 SS1]|uniref:MFS general substrate transporter n=1 Tax=Stereum hirsutum (strain FP-91666) TaxID=721885 RepID=UPI000440CA58|nr:MFS general substrate transporter [Stereum hirsutum FP-91666 SS1]EIM90905.1 MFS general substrate transporter [Stereum hirsutum FP-91666 SS1]